MCIILAQPGFDITTSPEGERQRYMRFFFGFEFERYAPGGPIRTGRDFLLLYRYEKNQKKCIAKWALPSSHRGE
jgi:hypothetical protein